MNEKANKLNSFIKQFVIYLVIFIALIIVVKMELYASVVQSRLIMHVLVPTLDFMEPIAILVIKYRYNEMNNPIKNSTY